MGVLIAQPPAQVAMSQAFDLEAQAGKAGGPSPPAARQEKAGEREMVWDNVKGICVLLVVLIHTLRVFEQEVMAEGHFASGLIMPLLLVVMPAFTFVSGYLSSVATSRRKLVALLKMWAVFVLQQVLYALFWVWQGQSWGSLGQAPFSFWSQPIPGVTWFLLCLAAWRTALPLLDLLRWPVATTLAVALLSQLTDTAASAYLQPMLCFLPFFMAGYRTPKAWMKSFLAGPRRPLIRWAFLGLLALCPMISLLLPQVPGGQGLFDRASRLTWSAYGCLYGGRIGDSLQQGGLTCHGASGAAGTAAFFLLSLPLLLAFLAAVPQRQVWLLSRAGAMSVYIYLFHIYFLVAGKAELLKGLFANGQLDNFSLLLHSRAAVPACIALAGFLWAFLASGWIRPVCMPLVEVKVEVCLRAPSDADEEAAASR